VSAGRLRPFQQRHRRPRTRGDVRRSQRRSATAVRSQSLTWLHGNATVFVEKSPRTPSLVTPVGANKVTPNGLTDRIFETGESGGARTFDWLALLAKRAQPHQDGAEPSRRARSFIASASSISPLPNSCRERSTDVHNDRKSSEPKNFCRTRRAPSGRIQLSCSEHRLCDRACEGTAPHTTATRHPALMSWTPAAGLIGNERTNEVLRSIVVEDR
jgi:hypothetical protein